MVSAAEMGIPVAGPGMNKKQRQAIRKAKRKIFLLKNSDCTKFKIAYIDNPWCYLWQEGSWKRHYNLSGDTWQEMNELEMLVLAQTSKEQIARMAREIYGLKINRDPVSRSRIRKDPECR